MNPLRYSTRRAAVLLLLAALAAAAAVPPAGAAGDDESRRQYRACVVLTQRAPEQALESARAWRDRGNGGFAARHCIALALAALNRPSEAAQVLQDLALAMKGEGVEVQVPVLAQAGNAWLLAGRNERARDVLASALAFAPDNVDLLIDHARALAALADYAGAFADLDRAVALDPTRADALALRAAARRRTGDRVRALEDAEMALALEPGNGEALLERGILRQEAGDSAGARADYLAVASELPGTPAADQAQARIEAMDLKVE